MACLCNFGKLLLHCRLPAVRQHVNIVSQQHEEVSTVCDCFCGQARPDPTYVALEHGGEALKVHAEARKKCLHTYNLPSLTQKGPIRVHFRVSFSLCHSH